MIRPFFDVFLPMITCVIAFEAGIAWATLPPRATVEASQPVTRPVLVESPLGMQPTPMPPISWTSTPAPLPLITVTARSSIRFASGISISPEGKVTIPPGVSLDEAARQFWDAIERHAPVHYEANP